MKITICGSMLFHTQMSVVKNKLETVGHQVFVPSELDNPKTNEAYLSTDEERITTKIEHDFIREHFRKIQESDAILVLNYEKKDVLGYIGGNTFLEMGLAFWLGKKIFALYPIPKMDYHTEMSAMQPIVLNGDLTKIV